MRESQLQNPSATILLLEKQEYHNRLQWPAEYYGYWWGLIPYHFERANLLFTDGHVGAHKKNECYRDFYSMSLPTWNPWR